MAMLDAITPYSAAAGSSRVRVHDWVARVPDDVRVHSYAGLPSASPGELIRHPRSVAGAERDLRQLARRRVTRLLLHREASPLSRGGLEMNLLSGAETAVYDFDDALHVDHGEGSLYRRLAPKARKARMAVTAATRVIAGNEVLADWASTLNSDVVIIPSCVDLADYNAKSSYRVNDPPRLGWVGSWSTEVHLREIAPALLQINAENGARLTVIGAPARTPSELDDMIDRVPWSLAAQEAGLMQFDVGLMPLINTPYARGKCGYKLLQYLAAGVPSIASPVGVNRDILRRSGMPAATTIDDWVSAIRQLLATSTDERAGLGERSRETVAAHYSYEAWRDTWRAATGLAS